MKKLIITAVVASAALLTACGGGGTVADATVAEPTATPMGSVLTSGYYQSPAAIRTRYGFDALPATPEGQGSGQLIAIISTYNNPDLMENVATFSAKYNLPQCTQITTTYIPPTTGYTTAIVSHPLVGQTCTIQVVNVDSFGRPLNTVYSSAVSSWNAESSMDAEWSHAMAPGASILIVQAPSPFIGALSNAARYASTIAGANVVSMSWGAAEASIQCTRRPMQPTVKYDPTCSDSATAAAYWNMWNNQFVGNATFVAASGDRGTLQWPSIQPNVLAVGGTIEVKTVDAGWSGSGGGISMSYLATPAQSAVTNQLQRAVPDVAYDAGTLVALYIKPNAATGWADAACVKAGSAANCGWYGGGGTSAGAPQWAGIVAVTNALRNAKRAPTIDFVPSLYTIGANPIDYAASFMDVTIGDTTRNVSKLGYDLVTGLGAPNASVLIGFLSN